MKTFTPTMSQLRLLSSLRNQQWLMRPDLVQTFALAAMDAAEGKRSEDFELGDFYELRPEPRIERSAAGKSIGIVYVQGTLLRTCPAIYEKLGLATCYSTIGREMAEVIGKGAQGILLIVDSPGGAVAGVIEGSAHVTSCPVPVVVSTAGLVCSAAYHVSSGARAIIATESAIVGNIGTILNWADCTEFWKEMGIEFKAQVNEGADLKSTFHLEPNPAQLAFLQEETNRIGEQFQNHVMAGRTAAGAVIDPEIWRAGWYSGERAGELGLIDAIGSAEDAAEYLGQLIGG